MKAEIWVSQWYQTYFTVESTSMWHSSSSSATVVNLSQIYMFMTLFVMKIKVLN